MSSDCPMPNTFSGLENPQVFIAINKLQCYLLTFDLLTFFFFSNFTLYSV
jgi:hypothetical protein